VKRVKRVKHVNVPFVVIEMPFVLQAPAVFVS
jgi:hypothetical protein